MKKVYLLFLLLPLAFFACGDDDNGGYGDDIILYTKWSFPVGAAVPGAATNNLPGSPHNNALNPDSAQHRLLRHFNVYVAENEMKPDQIIPSARITAEPKDWTPAHFNWTRADALVDYAEANGKRIRGHVLFWHAQTPAWFFRDGNDFASKELLYDRMKNYVRVVFEKYGGRIDAWDVANEVVDHALEGPRRGDDPNHNDFSAYTRIMEDAGLEGIDRYEYVLKAFEWARYYADLNDGENVKLYLTDFGIERPFTKPSGTTKQGDFEKLVDYLIKNNAPIDGVGFQGHFRLYDHPVEQIAEGIDLFAAKERTDGVNLKVQVCELDFSVFSGAKEEIGLLEIPSNLLNERLNDLADTYRAFFDMFEEKFKEGKLDMVLIWGLADGHSWLNDHPIRGRTDHPLLFDRNYRPKQVYFSLIKDR